MPGLQGEREHPDTEMFRSVPPEATHKNPNVHPLESEGRHVSALTRFLVRHDSHMPYKLVKVRKAKNGRKEHVRRVPMSQDNGLYSNNPRKEMATHDPFRLGQTDRPYHKPSILPGPYPQGVHSAEWHPQSPLLIDQGMRTSGFEMSSVIMRDRQGNVIGEIRVQHVTDETDAETYPNDAYRLNEILNLGSFRISEDGVWKNIARKDRSCSWYDPTGEAEPPEPEERDRQLAEHMDTVRDKWEERDRMFRVPFVAWSEVDDSIKGTGAGSWMYHQAAKKLGEEGKVLRESSNRSESAERLWSSFERKGQTSKVDLKFYITGETDTYRVLDYT